MAYDPVRKVIIMFGGSVKEPTILSDTWEWDGKKWKEVTPQNNIISGRYLHAMAYDYHRQNVIVFGGTDGNLGTGKMNDLWEWNGSEWVSIKPSFMPPKFALHAMAADPISKMVWVFGGVKDNEVNANNETWMWNGKDETWWEQTSSKKSPPARTHHAMVFDTSQRKLVLFGGTIGNNIGLDDTWTYDYNTWETYIAIKSPPARFSHAMAYDAKHEAVVMFSGFRMKDDTWVYMENP